MRIKEFKIPDAKTKIRRLDIAGDGMIWYVNSARGRLGRLDPTTGSVKEWPSPSGPKSHPYAIAVVKGSVWYNESGVRPDMLVRFDPKTETFQSWPIPSGNFYSGILRHLDVTRDGNLLIHQSATNRIIHVTLPPVK
jgi:virginiamycin B lyase